MINIAKRLPTLSKNRDRRWRKNTQKTENIFFELARASDSHLAEIADGGKTPRKLKTFFLN